MGKLRIAICGFAAAMLMLPALSVEAKPKKITNTLTWEVRGDTLFIDGYGVMPEVKLGSQKDWRKPDIWPKIRVIEIGEGITEIGPLSFYNSKYGKFVSNNNVVDLYLPNSLKEIGYSAFKDVKLNGLYLPAGLEKIDMGAFASRREDSEPDWGVIELPRTLKELSYEAFVGRNLKGLVFKSPAMFRFSAIWDSDSLEFIDLGNFNVPITTRSLSGVEVLPPKSLKRILNHKNTRLPYRLNQIARDKREPREVIVDGNTYKLSFEGHTAYLLKLAEITPDVEIVPEIEFEGERFEVTGFSSNIFRGNTTLTSVILPDGITTIGANAFRDCVNLYSISMSAELRTIGDFAFDNCRSLSSAYIPSRVTRIGDAAFNGCSDLTSVMIPDGVKYIGEHCFDSCPKLRSLTAPASAEKGHDWFNPGRYN